MRPFLFCRRKPGPLGEVRGIRLATLSKQLMVSGVRPAAGLKSGQFDQK
ncbi:hypothetical protein D1AOALGA4SA_9504 [Olavius algarvensis Delta 1 endosymbiont]|nr:hypothetical protein D1AOALGA4SA_9504 [Olavius algarvensis Delta 1 endosymbiont]